MEYEMKINYNSFFVKKLHKNATIPSKAFESDAGFDLYACLDEQVDILPGECKKISTGIAIELPFGTFGAIFARSGMATGRGLRPANAVGVVDSSYRGEYIVALRNDSKEIQTICDGDRIAQLVILPFVCGKMIEVNDDLSKTERGTGGFGSTGTK